ncbi:MAG: hypothetical protein HUJ54_02485 [Erysipelotrichaceae bacterium]|nr:hypothetical protein [Erysipelotrichaceae bacterium]
METSQNGSKIRVYVNSDRDHDRYHIDETPDFVRLAAASAAYQSVLQIPVSQIEVIIEYVSRDTGKIAASLDLIDYLIRHPEEYHFIHDLLPHGLPLEWSLD